MTLVATTASPLSLNDIQIEFGGANPISMSEYFSGGTYVPSGTTGTYGIIPASPAISISQFYGTSNFNYSNAGYWGGGSLTGLSSSLTAVIDGLNFASESIKTLSATLVVARYTLAGINSSTKGYWLGGTDQAGVVSTEIDGILFSNGTAINPAATLDNGGGQRFSPGGFSSTTTGYAVSGGSSVTNGVTFSFATEVTAIMSGVVFSPVRTSPNTVNSSTKGYLLGGNVGSAEIDGVLFSNNTYINPAAALVNGRGNCGHFNSTAKGYVMAGNGSGYGGTNFLSIEAFTFSTETVAVLAAAFSEYRNGIGAGVNSTTKGYQAGGRIDNDADALTSPGVITNKLEGLVFSSETLTTQSAVLSQGKAWASGLQSGSY